MHPNCGDGSQSIGAAGPSLDDMYQRYSATIFRQARSLLRDPDRARDATQEVFLRAAQDSIRMRTHPLPWLCRVTKNLCLNHIRDDQRQRNLLATRPPARGRDGRADARLAVNQLLARAPKDLQQVALCYYVDDLSHQEIAAVFGVSRRTIGNRLAAFEALAAELFGSGGA